MIKHHSLALLQKAINLALSLDESFSAKIAPLHGKVLKIVIRPLEVSFFIRFTEEGLMLLTDATTVPDATITSNPLGLIRLSLLPASKARSLFNDQVSITGDIEFGQAVKKMFDEIDIDWEGHLARFTGDVVAYQIGSFVRQGLAFKQQVKQSLRESVTEYLQEELQAFPSPEEMDDFFQEIDELSLKVERLAAHITYFKKSLSS